MTDIVIGMDTKSRSFHWVASSPVLDGSEYTMYGYVEEDEKLQIEVARSRLYWEADDLFDNIRVELDDEPVNLHVFCEEPLALQNGATTRILCLAAGAIWSGFVSSQVNATWYWVDVSTWKKDVLGRGAPPKGQKHKPWIAEVVPTLPEFKVWAPNEPHRVQDFAEHPDLYDAFCLMVYGVGAVRNIGRESR